MQHQAGSSCMDINAGMQIYAKHDWLCVEINRPVQLCGVGAGTAPSVPFRAEDSLMSMAYPGTRAKSQPAPLNAAAPWNPHLQVLPL